MRQRRLGIDLEKVCRLGRVVGLCSSRGKELETAGYNLERRKFTALELRAEITIADSSTSTYSVPGTVLGINLLREHISNLEPGSKPDKSVKTEEDRTEAEGLSKAIPKNQL